MELFHISIGSSIIELQCLLGLEVFEGSEAFQVLRLLWKEDASRCSSEAFPNLNKRHPFFSAKSAGLGDHFELYKV